MGKINFILTEYMRTSQKLILATLLACSIKSEDVSPPLDSDTMDADIAREIDAADAITKELDDSLHEDDIEHLALKKQIVEIHLADKSKMYNYNEILDVCFRYFVEEPLSEVSKHRLLHEQKNHNTDDEAMLANAAMVEHYIEHELDGKTELSASDLE